MRISHNTFITQNFSVEFAVGDAYHIATFSPVMDEDWNIGDRYDVQLSLVNLDKYKIGELKAIIYEKVWDDNLQTYLFDNERVINAMLKDPVKINISNQQK
tara:strand:- start:3399 stop:3701 length:303 start_codon:yes stop_codon:yes gene_type:complete